MRFIGRPVAEAAACLHAEIAGRQILRGIDLRIRAGEVHAVMGPNGSGKSTLSHVLLGRPGYLASAGRVTLDGQDLLELPTWRRAQAGLFLGTVILARVAGARWRVWPNAHPVVRLPSGRELDVVAMGNDRVRKGTPRLITVFADAAAYH